MGIEDNRRLQLMAEEQDFELYAYAGPETVFCVACAAEEDVENLSRLIGSYEQLRSAARDLRDFLQREPSGRFINLDKAYYLNDFADLEEILARFARLTERHE